MTEASVADGRLLPVHVRLARLDGHHDARGTLTEIFRASWPTGVEPIQWSHLHTEAGALRGPHAHLRHDDYVVLLGGRTCVGLRDLRRASPTFGLAVLLDMRAGDAMALTIPRGVLHAFCYLEESHEILGASRFWDPTDDLRCRWDDPLLGLAWPLAAPRLSPEDDDAPSLESLMATLEPHQPDLFAPPR
jgi:dTDP-4-dehydrorhamnose 3,5-epimerase